MPKAKLDELFARGLGVIEEARVEFGLGFNVITGETGAGKTLLLGALDLCLGGDSVAARNAITTEMQAAAIFNVEGKGEIVLSRESSSSGRLRSAVNGTPSSSEALRLLADELIVIHGQHDSLTLKNKAEILRIIDASGNIDTAELRSIRSQLAEAQRIRGELGGDGAQRDRDIDYLRFQLDEIESVGITSSKELDEVLSELISASELRDGQASLAEAVAHFDGESDPSVLDSFAVGINSIPKGDAYQSHRVRLSGILQEARDAVRELTSLLDSEAYDPERMKWLEDRAGQLQSIARKHGGSLESVLSTRSELEERLSFLSGASARADQIEAEIADLEARETMVARQVRREREFAAVKLTEAVRAQLPRVALPNASLRFEVDGDDGSDAQILFTPNPGLPEGPLQALASGGELSRVLLALSLETADPNVVAVFDEVDAGVGGQVAQQIGDCLREVGARQQVLAVTHLASVAAKADCHFVIEKNIRGGVAVTRVRQVEGLERVNEIARMLAGDEITPESQALAQKLLQTS